MPVPGANISIKPLSMNLMRTFFVFDRVIKDPDAFILKKLTTKQYKEKFREFLDIEEIETLTIEALMVNLMERRIVNPLEWAAIKEFDYEKNYTFLHKQFENMYKDSIPLYLTNIMRGMIYDYSVGDIYVWNEDDDVRQRYDLVCMFGKTPKIKYITGDFNKAIERTKPHFVYDWNIERVRDMNEYSDQFRTFYGVADYSFNFEDDEDNPFKLKYEMSKHKNVAFFANIIANERYKYKG